MEWTRASILTTSLGVEVVTGMLMTNGIIGTEVIDPLDRVKHFEGVARTWDYVDESLLSAKDDSTYVIFYVPRNDDGDAVLAAIRTGLRSIQEGRGVPSVEGGHLDARLDGVDFLGELSLQVELADDENWLHEWKKHFRPLKIGNVVIVPEWIVYEPGSASASAVGDGMDSVSSQRGDLYAAGYASRDEVVFRIDPGSAFGTGQHQTTQLCIAALQQWVFAGARVFDIGCGSGILSVIGLLLGASDVVAVDVDPAGAIAATRKNAALNPINQDNLTILAGDILTDEKLCETILQVGGKFDIVVANIVADVVGAIAPDVSKFLKAGGIFIASGIIAERLDDVRAAFESGGLSIVGSQTFEGWHSLVGRWDGR